MAKTAFLFPGQGSQSVGMGKDLADHFPVARAVFEEADQALGFSISKLCFEGPEEELRKTFNTQPAILTVSVAALRVMQEAGLACDITAGHSLGEYSALVAAGVLEFADANAHLPRFDAFEEFLPEDKSCYCRVLAPVITGRTITAAWVYASPHSPRFHAEHCPRA